MNLNTLRPARGSHAKGKRLGRGIGSGKGKTAGRGHKGQRARSGGYHKVGFEGGQMPIQRRMPKFGFKSRTSLTREEIRLSTIVQYVQDEVVDLATLRELGLIRKTTLDVKVIGITEVDRAITIRGLGVTKGAKAAIEAANGKVE